MLLPDKAFEFVIDIPYCLCSKTLIFHTPTPVRLRKLDIPPTAPCKTRFVVIVCVVPVVKLIVPPFELIESVENELLPDILIVFPAVVQVRLLNVVLPEMVAVETVVKVTVQLL